MAELYKVSDTTFDYGEFLTIFHGGYWVMVSMIGYGFGYTISYMEH